MLVLCQDCGVYYDDEYRWTICPHPGLDEPAPRKEPMPETTNQKAHHPSVAHLLQFFSYNHLPAQLQSVSRPFGDLASNLAETLPPNAETTTMLRKLLEAKDCAVRALLAAPVLASDGRKSA